MGFDYNLRPSLVIQLESIDKRYGPQALFESLAWHIRPGERIGLVGPNGAGKTTLVRILAGREQPDRGRVRKAKHVTLGYLPQEVMESGEGTILESALEGQGEVADLEREMHRLADRLAASPPRREAEELTRRYGEIQDRFSALGGYDLEARVKVILTGLGFDPDGLERPVKELSGGWQMRVALARLLLADPDLLLLDEPTNHLDLESLNWLEEFLQSRDSAFVVISHDRYFLNRMVGRVAELSRGKLTLYTGNYDRYVEERERRFAQVEAAARSQAREIERMSRFIDRFRYQPTKARQVQSRIKMLERMEKVAAPESEERSVRFRFPQPPRSGAVVIELAGMTKRYGDNTVYDGVDFRLRRGDRIALLGANGAGKSTLLKVLAGAVPIDGGQRIVGHNVSLSYYAQLALDALHPRNTVLGEISEAADTGMQPQIRGLLAAFLFEADEWEKRIEVLSGGEKARLALAKMLLRPANLLLLDEPTNHLDLRSRGVLEQALAEYTGTICFISHDRYFINKIATSVCEIGGGRLEIYPGNYDEYRDWTARRSPTHGVAAPEDRIATTGAAPGSSRKTSAVAPPPPELERAGRRSREQKRRAAEARQQFSIETRDLKRKLERIEQRIADEEKKLRLVEYELASPSTYRNPEKARGAARLQAELKEKIAALSTEWESLTESLEEAEARFRDEVSSET
jgi:ATP-binding cassette subfamily F protein 3